MCRFEVGRRVLKNLKMVLHFFDFPPTGLPAVFFVTRITPKARIAAGMGNCGNETGLTAALFFHATDFHACTAVPIFIAENR